MPLDPQHLAPAASLNRLHIVDLPGIVPVPDVARGVGDRAPARPGVRRRRGAVINAG